jgi:pimeloyl-ACP methyl ester carboxylesterase
MLAVEPFRALAEFAQSRLVVSEEHTGVDGHAVVLFPGLGADHRYMTPLAKHCERLGYAYHYWGRGRNTGPTGSTAAWLRELVRDINELIRRHRHGVTLIGWSLGGLYAREIAKALPKRVRRVITLGTPSASLRDCTNVGWLYELLNGNSATVTPELAATLRIPPPVPTTSIYSRSDGVVAWEACRIAAGQLTENVEVDSSHLGLVWHPKVLKVIAERLRGGTKCPRPARR